MCLMFTGTALLSRSVQCGELVMFERILVSDKFVGKKKRLARVSF